MIDAAPYFGHPEIDLALLDFAIITVDGRGPGGRAAIENLASAISTFG